MFITHADAQLYTVVFGNGPRTLLALGGWVGSWDLWAESFRALSQSWQTKDGEKYTLAFTPADRAASAARR